MSKANTKGLIKVTESQIEKSTLQIITAMEAEYLIAGKAAAENMDWGEALRLNNYRCGSCLL